MGEGTRGDIGCPTNAPTVDSAGLLTTGNISATATSAPCAFIGDGSGLTGVVASTGDRIVSGSTSLLAVSATGFISLTQAGTNTGWFDPARGLVTLGVSATGGISGTSGYFAGPDSNGTTAPLSIVDTNNNFRLSMDGNEIDSDSQLLLNFNSAEWYE